MRSAGQQLPAPHSSARQRTGRRQCAAPVARTRRGARGGTAATTARVGRGAADVDLGAALSRLREVHQDMWMVVWLVSIEWTCLCFISVM